MTKINLKIVFFWTSLFIMDVLIACGLGELWVRAFIPVKNIDYYVDDIIGVRYRPNQKTYGHVEEGYSNIAVTNSLGFHDIERSKKKKEDYYRIHIYGDSMIAGMGVQICQTISSLVERNLNNSDLPAKFEVLNMAAGTDATNGQVLTFREIGSEFEPDLVICHFMDDFGDNVLELSGVKHAPYYQLDKNNNLIYIPPCPKDTDNFINKFKRKWCFLYRLLSNKIIESKLYYKYTSLKKKLGLALKQKFSQLQNCTTDVVANNTNIKDLYINKSWPLTLKLICFFRDMAEENGSKFILSDGRTFDENVGTIYKNKDLEQYCISNQIAYIPSYKIIDKLEMEDKKKYFFIDGHPNFLGNQLISQFISEGIKKYLVENKLI